MDTVNVVKFPKLGLEFTIDRVAFYIFGMPVYWYGIIIAIGFFLAVVLGLRNSEKFGIKSDDAIDLVFWGAPIAIVCARLYYVIFNWHEFNGDIKKIINIRTGGLAIYGGLIGAVVTAYFFAKAKKIDFLRLADLGAPYFVMAQAIGRWGNFVNQEAFGTNTNLPWGMHSEAVEKYLRDLKVIGVDPTMPVHPTFLYESLWNFGVFLFLIWYRKRYRVRGELFSFYMLLYGIGRAWIEGLRTDSLYLGSFRISQVLAIVFSITFAVIIVIRHRTSKGELVYNALGQPLDVKDSENGTEYDTKQENMEKSVEESQVDNKKML
ncbi:MAG TPA: prolipoprotein diacylglyceryl transferase [Acetivibrio sp.]|uniref:prolipoprotein diacylglyceryl transferase n=1 Tax=Acetivibrio sp. TaxID=1872092 RepID=UPI002B5D3F30|nr:prolipoprotein diacylglyceryl transferase [Acetivibrio sp.]HOM01209.1 prolipoprotein diacylglyceryl transferase [Acetivibrio sp.]